MAKRMGGGTTKKTGRPFGENSNSGKGMMTAYTRPSGGTSRTMKITGKPARRNGTKNFKGRAPSNWTGF